jgi:hypothetical protein
MVLLDEDDLISLSVGALHRGPFSKGVPKVARTMQHLYELGWEER